MTVNPNEIPWLTTEQMVEVDRVMIEDLHISLIQMMENAGRSLARLASRLLNDDVVGKRIVVLAGTGGNGGGSLVAARRLQGWGARVSVFTTKPRSDLAPAPGQQLGILERMGVPGGVPGDLPEGASPELVLDGIVGYSLKGPPRGGAARLIQWANEQDAPVLSLDVPSGLDATSGQVLAPAIRARATMTLALPKEGLRAAGAREHVGALYLADIGVPPSVYAAPSLGLEVGPIFAQEDVIRLA